MIDWRIYYGDGTIIDATDVSLENVPTTDVQVIVSPDEECGRIILCRWDYYVWRDDCWFGCNLFGLFDYLTMDGMKKVLFGRTTQNERFRAIYFKAKDDPDFPLKTRDHPNEKLSDTYTR